jgi:hypothetical protein
MVDFRLKKGQGELESEEKLTTEASKFSKARTSGVLRDLCGLCGEAFVLSRTELEL